MAGTDLGNLSDRVAIGRVVGHHGLQGWLKVLSYTEPRESLLDYRPLIIGEVVANEFEGRRHGKGLMIRVAGFDDRTAAEALLGQTIWIRRSQLPEPEPGEYYWSDLEGCRVTNPAGHEFGQVERMMSTGANDVMVVRGDTETLIPFVVGVYVTSVDLERKLIQVDWEPGYL
ncbi:MAG: ribosome maturation factor RimM [Xanthomonadales bacterium]|nr:ribosome maturation factor RimM [Xanthomonadales bacterium]